MVFNSTSAQKRNKDQEIIAIGLTKCFLKDGEKAASKTDNLKGAA